ncbi:Gfo/Idh/MocA family oxidoreductase [Methylobacterium sp. C25]|uniref:Gfo/Idh/MocA family protein n=1 Tax=Methylobacterium sp. C25 TaxID=2721622 RepID=UPI001F3605CB|nr:Gfo/Idh/MocA family oxidoreductase [Methylobacterium sp. C25]MCE4226127.1 Gfo/Idh/MocA family oxidoreductase [Methylobacterium sp. C25]
MEAGSSCDGATSKDSVGWGIVGYGWVARDYMAPGIRSAGHRLVAVADPGAASRAAAQAEGARAHADIAGLIAEPEVEAVYVATPNHLHRAAVEALAASGKAILCEKPMAASLGDAEAMAAAVSRSGAFYGTAFDQRHHPAHRAMRDGIREGRLGTVTAVRIVYACWLDRAWASFQGQDNWRIDPKQAGGGALIDLAPHGLDLCDFLLDESIEDIASLTQARAQDYAVDDGALLIGRTASGVLANLHVAYNCPDVLPRRRLEVVGTKGMLTAIDTMGQTPGGRLTFTDGTSGESETIAFDAEASPFLEQVRAFGSALRRPEERAAYSAERDLHTMRLLARAYGEALAPAA